MFVIYKPFEPSLMFVGKYRAYLIVEQLKCALTGFSCKHWTRMERPARDKRSRLLRKFVNYGLKKFYNIGSGPNVVKLLFSVFYDLRNKLKYLSLAIVSNLV